MTTDQHGRPRVRGGRLDIGAYEAAPAPLLTAPAAGARTTATPTLTVVTEPFNTVTFRITKASDSSTITITQIADANGNLSVTSPALSEDSYSVSAIARLVANPRRPNQTAAHL
jgi:recombinational DNA repair protein (RecF pathway)